MYFATVNVIVLFSVEIKVPAFRCDMNKSGNAIPSSKEMGECVLPLFLPGEFSVSSAKFFSTLANVWF